CGETLGQILVTATGTGTLQYAFQPPLPLVWSNASTLQNVPTGNITVWVRDMEGCTTSQTVVMPTTPSPNITNVNSVDPDCGEQNGSITVTASGGTAPLQYQINNGPLTSNNSFVNL